MRDALWPVRMLRDNLDGRFTRESEHSDFYGTRSLASSLCKDLHHRTKLIMSISELDVSPYSPAITFERRYPGFLVSDCGGDHGCSPARSGDWELYKVLQARRRCGEVRTCRRDYTLAVRKRNGPGVVDVEDVKEEERLRQVDPRLPYSC